MTAHTPGRLVAVAGGNEPAAYLQDEQNFAVARVINVGLTGAYAANARRLAACWNACDGVSTGGVELIAERGGILQTGVNRAVLEADLRAVEANYEAARVLLADILKADDEAMVGLKEFGMPIELCSMTERIRAFLESKP